MSRQLCTVVAFLAWVCLPLFAGESTAAQVESGRVGLSCAPRAYDFGEVESGTKPKAQFVLRNNGNASVHVRGIQGACCGTTASLEEADIEPGGTCRLDVSINLIGRKGPFEKHLTVLSNDAREPEIPITIVGRAFYPVDVEPRSVDFGVVSVGDGNTKTLLDRIVQIVCRPDHAFHVTNIVVSGAGFTAECTHSASGLTNQLTVHLLRPLPPAGVRGCIVLSTDCPVGRYRHIEIPVVARTPAAIFIDPPDVVVSETSSTNDLHRFFLRAHDRTPFQVTGVALPDPAMTVSCSATSTAWQIELRGVSSSPLLDGREIVITTDRPGQERVLLPIRYLSFASP
jgi:hypothetical protein